MESGGHKEWGRLFKAAFTQSRNPMALLDERRCHVEVNGAYISLLGYPARELIGHPVYEFIVGGPQVTAQEWMRQMDEGSFSRQTEMRCSDGHTVTVQWAATVERVTGRRLVLFVALSTSRWGAHARRARTGPLSALPLTARELEVVRLIALGSTGPEIADELHIAHDTVRAHARNAMLKSGARSRAHLVAKVLGEGLILTRPGLRRKPAAVAEAAGNGEAVPPKAGVGGAAARETAEQGFGRPVKT
ncbi:MAG TPA: LuxR C-terminal-related transcriptional regulator [Solirubrobacteraceae bacterium]|nr:LuxR C-terminal-related transcriptional regulator [Solirubrobacteraceae bacterium]